MSKELIDKNDLQIIRLCAQAIGLPWEINNSIPYWINGNSFNPLIYDDQAMALIKKLGIKITSNGTPNTDWLVECWNIYLGRWEYAEHSNLNRAVCECVAHISHCAKHQI